MARIHFERRGRTVIITMEGDTDLNVAVVNDDLHQRLLEYRDDNELWCCIITGAGQRAFTAGGNIRRFANPERAGPGFDVWSARPLNLLTGAEFWKPVIAAINGYCIGAGLMLACASDIRIASENATFAMTEVKLGFPPGNGALQRLPRVIPLGPALEMLLTGDSITAQQAYQWGLVNKVVPLPELINAAMEMAGRIVANPPLAVRSSKELVYRGLELPLEQGIRMAALLSHIAHDTEDAQEGPRAFVEKRTPEFKGQ